MIRWLTTVSAESDLEIGSAAIAGRWFAVASEDDGEDGTAALVREEAPVSAALEAPTHSGSIGVEHLR